MIGNGVACSQPDPFPQRYPVKAAKAPFGATERRGNETRCGVTPGKRDAKPAHAKGTTRTGQSHRFQVRSLKPDPSGEYVQGTRRCRASGAGCDRMARPPMLS